MTQQNNEKLTDKAFSRLIACSIFGVLLCIVCLCSTTYAWFIDSSVSNNNSIKTAQNCLLEVKIEDVSDEQNITVLNIADTGILLEQGKLYKVTLTLPKDSSSGYCMIIVNDQTYYTDYISHHTNDIPQTISFKLSVSESQTIKFKVHWGIYSGNINVYNNGELFI